MSEKQFQRIGSNELMRANRMNSNELKCALISMNVIFKKGLQPQSYYRNIYLEEMNKRAERVSLQLSFENTVQLQNSPLSKSSSAKKITSSSAKKNNNNSSAQRSSSKDLSDLNHNNSFTAFSNNKMSSNNKNNNQPTGYLQQAPRITLFDSILPDQNHHNNNAFLLPSPGILKNPSQEKNIFQENQEMISSTPWDNLLGNGFGNDANQDLRLFEHQSSQKDHSGLSQRNTSASPSSEQIIQKVGQIKNVTTFETYSVREDGDSRKNSNINSRDNSISNGKRSVMKECLLENEEVGMDDFALHGNNSRYSFEKSRKTQSELENFMVSEYNNYCNGIEEVDINKMNNPSFEQKKNQGFLVAQGKENNSQLSRSSNSKISASKENYQQSYQEKERISLNLSQHSSQLQQPTPQSYFQGDYHEQPKKEQQSLGSIFSSISISEHAFQDEHREEQKPLADAAYFDNQNRSTSFISDRSDKYCTDKKVSDSENSSRISKVSNGSSLTQQQRRYTNQFLGKSQNRPEESFAPGNLQTIKKILLLIVFILLISQVFKHLDMRVSNEKEHQKTNKKQNYIEGQRNINDLIETNGGFDGYDNEMSSYWTARNKLLPDIIIADLYNELKSEMNKSPNGLLSLDYIEQRLFDSFENDQHHVQLYLTKLRRLISAEGEIYESLDSHNHAVFILKKQLH